MRINAVGSAILATGCVLLHQDLDYPLRKGVSDIKSLDELLMGNPGFWIEFRQIILNFWSPQLVHGVVCQTTKLHVEQVIVVGR
jgi:hypothetical protein